MASMANAFSILVSGEQPSQNAAKNKKKKNKAKQKTAADEGAPAVATETMLAEPSRTEEVVELADAVPILEKSARTQGPNRIKLWKDWQRQATDRSPKALKYRAPDGSLIQFKELVLRSRALEIAAEGCIASPLSSDETHSLQQLLSTFLPRTDTSALAAAISRLSELLAEDSQSFDTVGAAQRAVHNVISTLKAAKDGSEAAAGKPATLQDRLSKIEREASKQHGFLASVEKLAAQVDVTKRAPTTSGISRAHVDSASELVKLYADKFDLLHSGASGPQKPAGSGPSAATVKALEELKTVINGHLKEASSLEQNVKGKAVSAEAKRAQAVASIRREEAVLSQQASELAGQIRVLESQLAQLRSQAAEVEDKRAKLHQRQSAALDALSASTGRKLPGLSAQHYNNELAAADQLLAVVDPSYCAADGQQLAAAQAEHGNSAEQFMAAVRNMMQMSSSLLADVPSKVEFCRQRIAQADKLAALGGLGQEKSAKTREEATKLMNELVKNVTDVLGGAKASLEAMRGRYTSFTQAQQAGLSQVAYEVEDLMGFIQRQHDTAMGAMQGQVAAAPPMSAAAAPGAAGSPSRAPMGGFSGKPAAAAPGALLSGGADGAPLAPTGGRPNYGASLGPIQPPAAASAPKATAPKAAPAGKGAPASNGHAAPRPASAAAAAAAPAANDGFQQVGGKKNRRKA